MDDIVLKIYLDNKPVHAISKGNIPCESKITTTLGTKGLTLSFVEPEGIKQEHILSHELGHCCFNVRIHENNACQIDCIISDDELKGHETIDSEKVVGVRFQPFFLFPNKVENKKLKGRGLFYRGLHFAGTTTPSTVSLSCICDGCAKCFRIKSFHSGFNNTGYFYSKSGKETLVVDSSIKGCPIANKNIDLNEIKNLEKMLPTAKDNTTFNYFNSFKCFHCGCPYIDFEKYPEERAIEYYGNYFYGQEVTRYDGTNA